jgi:hypothetical protein
MTAELRNINISNKIRKTLLKEGIILNLARTIKKIKFLNNILVIFYVPNALSDLTDTVFLNPYQLLIINKY